MRRLAILALLLLGAAASAAPASTTRPHVKGQWLIRFLPGAASSGHPKSDARDELHASLGSTRLKRLDAIQTDLVQFPEGADEESLAARYRQSPLVITVEPNGIIRKFTSGPTNQFYDGFFGGVNYEPWYDQIRATQAYNAWNSGQIVLKNTVIVAVVDTGTDLVSELAYGQLLNPTNYSDDATTADLDGHGTFVSGIIAAATNQPEGIAGVFFDTALIRILPIKVLDQNGTGSDAALAQGLIDAQDQGAKVINLSLGGPASSSTVQAACDYARQGGAFIVAAAGNDNGAAVSYPAAYPDMFAVGAVDATDTLTPYSNFGRLDLSAPGGMSSGGWSPCPCTSVPSGGLAAIWSLCNNSGGPGGACDSEGEDRGGSNGAHLYHNGAGTSFSTPMVAATAALLLSQDNTRGPDDLYRILTQSADPTAYGSGYTPQTGWGRLDVYRALTYSGGPALAGSGGKIKVYNWPNPFNPDKEGITNITFFLDQPFETLIQVRDLSGDLVFQQKMDASQTVTGMNILPWNGRNGGGRAVSNGAYLLTVVANSVTGNNRIMVLR